MNPRILPLLVGLLLSSGLLNHASAQGTNPPSTVSRRWSAVPGRVFPKEPRSIRPTASDGSDLSGLQVRPFQLDDQPDSSVRENRPPAGPTVRRSYQNANPPRMSVGFNRGPGVMTYQDQLQAQRLGLQRAQAFSSAGSGGGGFGPGSVFIGMPLNGGIGGQGLGGFALFGLR